MTLDFCCPLCGYGAGVRLPQNSDEGRIRCLNCGGESLGRPASAPGTFGFDAEYQRALRSLKDEARAGISRSA